jgi:hypothetical protein
MSLHPSAFALFVADSFRFRLYAAELGFNRLDTFVIGLHFLSSASTHGEEAKL